MFDNSVLFLKKKSTPERREQSKNEKWKMEKPRKRSEKKLDKEEEEIGVNENKAKESLKEQFENRRE